MATELISQVIEKKMGDTHPTAPAVLNSDATKVESIVYASRRLVAKLDDAEELDDLLQVLIKRDKGPSHVD